MKATGCQLHTIDTPDGKLTPELLTPFLCDIGNIHHTQPRVISITQCTEVGTVYSREELTALCDFAHQNGLYVHLDGARIANALVSLGCDAKSATVDCGIDIMQLTIIGAGNMGSAIAQGLFKHKTTGDNLQVVVTNPGQTKLDAIAPFCDATFTDNAQAAAQADIILIAVKPWLVDRVIADIRPVIDQRSPIIVSIAAGVTIERLQEQIGRQLPTFRVIPNTAISLAESMYGILQLIKK